MTSSDTDTLFLPDFCGLRRVLTLLVMAELLALVLALGAQQSADRWSDLGVISLFVQWVALASGAALCIGRRWLKKLSNSQAAAVSYMLLLGVTALLSEAAYRLLQSDALGVTLPPGWHGDFLLRNLGVSAIVSALALRYFYVQHQWKSHVESETTARIQALQSRMRPHFFFNSMNTIASLTRSRPDLAEAAVENLADLFRGSLSDARDRVTLADELELARKYVSMEKLRLGERLTVEWNLDGVPQDALLPRLSLQPLLENAIYHGVEPLPEGGAVTVRGEYEQGRVRITIANPLARDPARNHTRGNRMAVENLRERLQGYYGANGELLIEEEGGDEPRYRVRLSFPYHQA
ncbi:MAG: sensor histidine kinase [Gammaproteobacteria bacterium]|nr:sensor histidine kinase [Gammaproteobacteria bacterium]